MNNLKEFILTNLIGDNDSGGDQLKVILASVVGALLGVSTLIITIGAIRAAISLSHAVDEVESARHKKRLVNCIIAVIVCATCIAVGGVLYATAGSWVPK